MNMQVRHRPDHGNQIQPSRCETSETAAQTVLIALLPGFHLTELSACLDIFATANECAGRAIFETHVVSPVGGCMTSSTGLGVSAEDIGMLKTRADYIIIPGCAIAGDTMETLRRLLRTYQQFSRHIIALSSVVDLLVRLRVLEETDVSAHWNFSHPAQDYAVPANRKLFHRSGRYITSAGFLGTYDLLLHLIAKQHGWFLAGEVSDRMIKGEIRYEDAPQRRHINQRIRAKHKGLAAAIGLIEENLESPVPISDLARAAGYSVRQLEREFSKYYGLPPGRYYKNRRLDRAKAQIEQTAMPVIEIALANGFESTSHFSKSFSQRYGRSPYRLRKTCLGTPVGHDDH
ncbi:GlxA family transcriptional regulator [Roseovarius pelagicus]|uniref:Helix-turn-helix domain-containing protein n=1 Tax=Roseovarius pelagicus TaxID=2980108 RepID=A0ABY6D8U9_9RHOB|nr:helix-turn-helix domain-containing protein [Roseovarius pelagicus]UXX82552.1 helix-turn-helix domain-containing protein [Roseovarius pelagicus]